MNLISQSALHGKGFPDALKSKWQLIIDAQILK
jgi:hypothetical protein